MYIYLYKYITHTHTYMHIYNNCNLSIITAKVSIVCNYFLDGIIIVHVSQSHLWVHLFNHGLYKYYIGLGITESTVRYCSGVGSMGAMGALVLDAMDKIPWGMARILYFL